jgi:hypothetical protein
MHLLFDLILIFLFIPSYLCLNNFTYVFSYLPTTTIQSILSSNGFIVTNTSLVKRLLTSGVNLLNATEIILSSNDTQSIAFSWNTGDCSFPSALALKYSSIDISSPICYSVIDSSISNILQLTVTTKQLANAAAIFMTQYSLTYFSLIISSSNSFYFNLAQEFSAYLTEQNSILEQFMFTSSFPPSSVSIRSKG